MSTNRGKADSGRDEVSVPPSRRGKKAVTVYFEPDVVRRLKLIGIDADKSLQEMMTEAVQTYLGKHSKRQGTG